MNNKKNWILCGIIVFILSLIPIFSLVFDYQEWDESQYTLASYDNYNYHRYLTYTQLNTSTEKVETVSFPYPNILYSWSFGAFNSIFHLPTNHDSRMKFTLFLSLILVISIIIFYFVQNFSYKGSILLSSFGALFFSYFVFTALWKVRNAQLGGIFLFFWAVFFLIQSYQKPSKVYLFEILSILFLAASFYWKEQIIAIMLIFPWFFSSQLGILKKRYRVLLYYIFLALIYLLLYWKIHSYSLASGFDKAEYFYSQEGSHWGGKFNITVWFSKLITIPMSYYVVFFAFLFIFQRDYKKLNQLENKMFVVGFSHFILTSTLYFYQSTGYIAAINYSVPVLFMPYITKQFFCLQPKIHNVFAGFLAIFLIFPFANRIVSNYFPSRGQPIIQWLTQKKLPDIPCIAQNKIAALNIATLAGVHLTQDMRDKPILQYKEMDEALFLKSLEKWQPEVIIYYADPTEYPEVDRYMQLYRVAKNITTSQVHYHWIKDISPDVMVYLKQSH